MSTSYHPNKNPYGGDGDGGRKAATHECQICGKKSTYVRNVDGVDYCPECLRGEQSPIKDYEQPIRPAPKMQAGSARPDRWKVVWTDTQGQHKQSSRNLEKEQAEALAESFRRHGQYGSPVHDVQVVPEDRN